MKSVRLRTLVLSSLLGAPIAVAFACGGHASRHFDDPPVDSGEGGAGSGGRDGSGGSMGGAGTGGGTNNPGCTPPSGELAALQLVSAFPGRKDVIAGEKVEFEFGELAKDCGILECRRTQGDDDPGNWVPCATEGGNVSHIRLFTAEESNDDEFNGVWKLDVREAYDGASGPIFSYEVYTHDSLHGVERCPSLLATDEQILQTAYDDYFESLETTFGEVIQFTNYSLTNPFVRFEFQTAPFTITSGIPREGVAVGDGEVVFRSLRRRFVMNEAETLVLMKRIYPSRRNSNNEEVTSQVDAAKVLCQATQMRVHHPDAAPIVHASYDCDAVVMNARGFGVCLSVNGPTAADISRVYATGLPTNASPSTPPGYIRSVVDSFMWKKLAKYTRPRSQQGMGYFSPKCDDTISCEENDLFLPHAGLF